MKQFYLGGLAVVLGFVAVGLPAYGQASEPSSRLEQDPSRSGSTATGFIAGQISVLDDRGAIERPLAFDGQFDCN